MKTASSMGQPGQHWGAAHMCPIHLAVQSQPVGVPVYMLQLSQLMLQGTKRTWAYASHGSYHGTVSSALCASCPGLRTLSLSILLHPQELGGTSSAEVT